MAKDLSIGPAQLHGVADDLRAESAKIAGALAELVSEMDDLKASWTGSAQREYDAAHAEWSATITHMNAVLARIASGADATADAFTQADSGAATAFGA